MRRIRGILAVAALCVTLTAAMFQASVAPIGNWALDETVGNTAVDASGTSNGMWVGNPVPQAAPLPPLSTNTASSRCLDFDGTGNQYVEIPNVAALENVQEASYTLAAWVRPMTVPPGTGAAFNAAYAVIIKAGYHEGLIYQSDQHFGFQHWATGDVYAGNSAGVASPTGSFYHVAAVWDRTANQALIYVNGALQGTSASAANNREYNQNPWRIGIAYQGTGNYTWPMDGQIDDARIYNYALTASQIAVLAAGMPAPTNLTATTPTFQAITLNWTAPPQAGVTYTYRIERRSGAGAFSQIGTTSATTYVDSLLLPYTTYDYRVIAVSVATSGPSNIASAMETLPPPRTTKSGPPHNQCGCGAAEPIESFLVLGALAATALLLLCTRRA